MELGIGNLQASARIKVADINSLLERFEEFCLIDMQKSKRTTYEKIWYIRKFLKWLKVPSQPITRATIREYLKTLNGSSVATYKNCLGSLKTFFRDYLQMPHVVQGFKFPKQQFKPKKIPTDEQVRTFYHAIGPLKQEALYLIYATSGLRRNEVLGLTIEDVDFEKRMIQPGMHTGDTKKAWISFYNEETVKVLNEYLEGRSDGNRARALRNRIDCTRLYRAEMFARSFP